MSLIRCSRSRGNVPTAGHCSQSTTARFPMARVTHTRWDGLTITSIRSAIISGQSTKTGSPAPPPRRIRISACLYILPIPMTAGHLKKISQGTGKMKPCQNELRRPVGTMLRDSHRSLSGEGIPRCSSKRRADLEDPTQINNSLVNRLV
jgi:hypothetical protein